MSSTQEFRCTAFDVRCLAKYPRVNFISPWPIRACEFVHAGASVQAAAAAIAAESNAASPQVLQAYDDPDDPMLGSRATKALASVVATLSFYAVHVHVMFGFVFIVDFSVAAAVYPVGALLYALVRSPSSKFWQALLIYTEGLLLVQYVFQVALRAGCISLETDAMRVAYCLGLHSSAVRLRSAGLALAAVRVLRVAFIEGCF